jgi:hypothetical protein
MTRILLVNFWFVDVGCPLWWEDGSVVYSCCWASPAQSFLGPNPAGHSQIWDSFNLEYQVPVFIYPKNRVAYLYPCWDLSQKSKAKLYYDRQSVGQSLLVSGTHLGPATNSSKNFFFRNLRVSYCGAPSLTRGRVCNLQCNDASSVSSYMATDGLSASLSWCRVPWPDFDFFVWQLLSSQCRAPSPISPMNRVIQPKVKSQCYVSVRPNC